MLQIWVDAQDPSSRISARNARTTIRRLVGGFKAHGVREGDCICLVAFNNVSPPPTGHTRHVVRPWLKDPEVELRGEDC